MERTMRETKASNVQQSTSRIARRVMLRGLVRGWELAVTQNIWLPLRLDLWYYIP